MDPKFPFTEARSDPRSCSLVTDGDALGDPLEAARIRRAKAAYTTRHVPPEALARAVTGSVVPRAGDLVLARVDELRQHGRIELANGRKATLYRGDEIVVCYANRYAPDQFEAEVPRDLSACHLVAGGGVAARMLSRNRRVRAATRITPLALVADPSGRIVNLSDWGLPEPFHAGTRPFTAVVAGTSMNAGKTSTAAALIRGLTLAGFAVGAAKVTGTGAGGDVWKMADSGAQRVLDFTDAGLASTYREPMERIEQVAEMLIGHLARDGVEAVVLEVADGLIQDETARLLASEAFRSMVDVALFAAGDALGAAAGVEWLRCREYDVVAVSGTLCRSPLAVREAMAATGLQVLGLDALADPEVAATLYRRELDHALKVALGG